MMMDVMKLSTSELSDLIVELAGRTQKFLKGVRHPSPADVELAERLQKVRTSVRGLNEARPGLPDERLLSLFGILQERVIDLKSALEERTKGQTGKELEDGSG